VIRVLAIAALAIAAFVAGCAPKAMPLTPAHPAHAGAPTGRLAGPPPALRPGVVASEPHVEAPPAPSHRGHEGHH
jgi:hypothetical protein